MVSTCQQLVLTISNTRSEFHPEISVNEHKLKIRIQKNSLAVSYDMILK